MSTLELKQKIIDKIKSVDDVHLLQQVLNLLQPADPNEIRHLNENEMEMAKDRDEDVKPGNDIYHKQLDKENSEWITEL